MTIKQIILTIALTAITLLVKGQEKYEYVIIEYNSKGWIAISTDNGEFIKEDVDNKKYNTSRSSCTPLLAKVKEYEEKGWTVMTYNTFADGGAYDHWAYLRRPKGDRK